MAVIGGSEFVHSPARALKKVWACAVRSRKSTINHLRREVLLLAEKRAGFLQLQEIALQAGLREHIDRQGSAARLNAFDQALRGRNRFRIDDQFLDAVA